MWILALADFKIHKKAAVIETMYDSWHKQQTQPWNSKNRVHKQSQTLT